MLEAGRPASGKLPVLDGVSNNAGITKLVPLQFIGADDFERIHKVNLLAPILLTKYLVKKKKIAKGGSIVFTASAGGVFVSSFGNAIYATSKCGVDGYMRTAALELAPKGIRCNSVNPGMVETPLINSTRRTRRIIRSAVTASRRMSLSRPSIFCPTPLAG